jgi:hypothetical protein
MTNNYNYVLSLHAYKATTKVKFTRLINLGFVEKDKPVKFRIPFSNVSDVPARLTLAHDINKNPEIAFDSVDIRIKPN